MSLTVMRPVQRYSLVDDQQLLDAVLMQQALGILARDVLAHRHQLFLGHQLGDRLARIAGEAHVAVGQDARAPSACSIAALDHRNARDPVVGHQPQRVGQRLVGVDRDRVDHHPGLELLDLADFGRLLVDRHVAVNDAEPAGLGHRDRQSAFGHGVHRRRDQRDAEFDLAGDAGPCVGLARQDARCGRHQHHVVKGQRLPDFHRAHLRGLFGVMGDYVGRPDRRSSSRLERHAIAPAMRRRGTPWRRHRSRPIRRGLPPAWRGAPRRIPASGSTSRAPSVPPWNTLATKAPPGLRIVPAKPKGVLGQRDDAQMVGRGMAGRRRRHVAQHHIGRAAERRADALGGGGIAEIAGQQGARRPIGSVAVEVDADDFAARVRRAAPRPGSSRRERSRDRRRAGRAPADESARRAAISLKAARER